MIANVIAAAVGVCHCVGLCTYIIHDCTNVIMTTIQCHDRMS